MYLSAPRSCASIREKAQCTERRDPQLLFGDLSLAAVFQSLLGAWVPLRLGRIWPWHLRHLMPPSPGGEARSYLYPAPFIPKHWWGPRASGSSAASPTLHCPRS